MKKPNNFESRIAVVGMGCRFPGADSPAEFWRNLKAGAESLTFFSEDELRQSGVAGPWLSDPNYVRASTILKDIESFDARFFDVSAAEARSMDPQHRLLLECAWEALESSGHSSSENSQPVAVFAGVRINEYLLFHLPLIDTAGLTTQSQLEGFQRLVASDKDFAATRISHKLRLGGPSMTVQSACSTSLVAIHMACQSLLNGECDIALAGGASVRVPQRAGYLHAEGMIASADGHTRAFDAAASGTVFGSGAGMVALRRLDDAVRDGDPIQAVILGSAVNNDAGSARSFTAPSREGQLRVLTEAYGVADVSPATLGYIEAHGTATALGDSVELSALLDLFRSRESKPAACAVGSVKTNIGHLIHAAGVAGFIKAVLMLKHGQLVPSLNFRHPNPNVELAGSPLYINVETRPWPVNGSPRRAGVSAFGVGGTNAHVVLEEFTSLEESTPSQPAPDPELPYSVLVLSARDPKALRDLADRYGNHMNQNRGSQYLFPACHTAAVGRVHFEHRLAVTAPDSPTLEHRLAAFVRDGRSPGVTSGRTRPGGERPRVAFLFTGLGSQYRAMGCDLYRTHALFRSLIDECAECLRPYLSAPLTEILETQELLEQPEYAQPALFVLEYALARLWISWGIPPDVVLGHSFGEYAAAHVAGVFSLEDGLRLAARRGRITKELSGSGRMLAVFASAERITSILEAVGGVSIAAYNGPSSCSISGDSEAVLETRERLVAAGIQTAPIPGNLPFHSILMNPCLPAIGREIEECRISAPGPRFISSLTGSALQGGELGTPDYWMRQTRDPVRFMDAMAALRHERCDVLIEIGPAPLLLALGRECWPDSSALWLPTLRANRPAWRQISESVGELYTRGANINWKAFYEDQGPACTRVELPTYPFQRSRYWIDGDRVSSEPPHLPGHPLLGRLLESPLPQKQFQARIHPKTAAYIQDHSVLGQVLLPGAAYIETARAAWAEACAGDGPVVIENLSMQRALVLDESRSHVLHTILEQAGSFATVRIFSLESAAGQPDRRWLLHAECQVGSGAKVRPAPIAWDQIRSRCTTAVAVEPFYARKVRRGSAGGPSYQSIRQIWRGQGESLSRVELTPTPGEHWPPLHPAALSCCIQPGGEDMSHSPLDGFPDHTYLPYLWERICIYAPLPENVWSHVREISNGPDLRTVDATIFDDAGNVLVAIEGLHFRRATKETLLGHAQASAVDQDLIYELQWRSAPMPERAAPTPGRWIVVGPEHLTTPLCKLLGPKARGSEELILSPAHDAADGIIHIAALDDRSPDPVSFEHHLCEGALKLVQGVIQQGASTLTPKLVFVTRGTQGTGLETGPISVAGSTLWGFGKSILREHPALGCKIVDLDPALDAADALETLVTELNAGDAEPLTAWRDGRRLVPRLERCGSAAGGGSYSMNLERPGTLSSFTIRTCPVPKAGPGQVVVRVVAAGLNFRDVLIGLGRMPGQLGFEFSGEILGLGRGVQGLELGAAVYGVLHGQMASHVVADAFWLAPKPRNLTFTDAASIPVAFVTALCALRDIANLQSGERVLIHSAAGGVGQAAIQVAKLLGVQIFATASRRKWTFLRSLGVEHIADSRRFGFGQEILDATGGEGVDAILNTLAGEFNEESARALKPGGRFVELGLNNAEFTPLSLDQHDQQHPGCIRKLLTEIAGHFESGALKLPPVQVFPIAAAARALDQMAAGKHIGKFVLSHFGDSAGASPGASSGIRIHGEATYLITGGLGGLGQCVANWFADQGARSLVLIGRRTPDTQGAAFIEGLRTRGVSVLSAAVDVTDASGMKNLFAQIEKGLPPLRGVVHAAGVLNDGTLLDMAPARLLSVLKPKLDGTWNLHRLTENRTLDFFVLFSSTSGLWGAPGQANYAAANAFLDSAAHYRRQRGLPATSIDWSAWAEVGMAAAMDDRAERYRQARGMGKIPPQAGVRIFGWALNQPRTQLAASKIDWQLFGRSLAGGGLAPFFQALTATPASSEPHTMDRSALRTVFANSKERKRAVEDHILDCAAAVLGLDRTTLRMDQPLQDYGLDSLMALQLRNRVMEPLANVHIPWANFQRAGSISALSGMLAAALEGNGGGEADLPSQAAVRAAVQEGVI